MNFIKLKFTAAVAVAIAAAINVVVSAFEDAH